MSRNGLIHRIFSSIKPASRGFDRKGDHFVVLVSDLSRRSRIPLYATLEKLSEEELRGIALDLGVRTTTETV